MQNQVITFPAKPGPRAIHQFSRLVVLGLRILDAIVLVVFAAAVIYLLGTILP
jgi:hypothetical protein